MDIFEKASRKNLLIVTGVGMVHVNDLWDMPLLNNDPTRICLNDVAKTLSKHIQDAMEENFVTLAGAETSQEDDDVVLALDIVKHIIAVKIKERDDRINAVARKEKEQKIMEAIVNKESSQLAEASIEELRSMLAAL